METNEPSQVRLTQDFQDPKMEDVHFKAGTILTRNAIGQYLAPHTTLGMPCVTRFFLIRDICESIY